MGKSKGPKARATWRDFGLLRSSGIRDSGGQACRKEKRRLAPKRRTPNFPLTHVLNEDCVPRWIERWMNLPVDVGTWGWYE
jgi:hypothetical protein